MTDAESAIWQQLRSCQMHGYKFRRQVPIGRFIVDFVCHEQKLAIEIDGGQHDLESECEQNRSEFIEKQGYQILRFWNHEVLENIDGVCEVISSGLLRHHPHPTLPHKGGGLPLVADREAQ